MRLRAAGTLLAVAGRPSDIRRNPLVLERWFYPTLHSL